MNREQAEAAARKGAKVRHEGFQRWESWVTYNADGRLVDCFGNWRGPEFPPDADGWSIIPETAPTAEPDLAERVAAVEARMDRLEREHTVLTDSERDAFMAAIETPVEPTPALRKTLAAYRANTQPAAPPVTRAEFGALVARMKAIENIVIPTPPYAQPTPATREALDDVLDGRVMSDDEIVRTVVDRSFGKEPGAYGIADSAQLAIDLTRASVIAEIEAARVRAAGDGVIAALKHNKTVKSIVDAAIDHILSVVRK